MISAAMEKISETERTKYNIQKCIETFIILLTNITPVNSKKIELNKRRALHK